jgi:EmrB/QacA subfamily drug resistance transporter
MSTASRKTKLVTLGVMCFALFMIMLDSSVVNLALPTIEKRLGASLTELQWIVDAYILLLASLLLSGGTLGDMFGRKRAFVGGLALFTLGSLACALAPSTGYLIGFRALQGVGAAVMMPSTLSILTNTFLDPRERARAIGTWAAISGLALAIGPLVGGTMVDAWGWQSVFWINVPIGAIACVIALVFVPESSDRAGRSLDLLGQLFAVVGLATLTYAFIEANNYGWSSTRILTCFVVAAVTLAAFVIVEWRGKSPMLDLSFFRNTTFAGANLVGLIVSFAFFGVLFFLGLYFQNVLGYSPTKAGVYSLPATLGITATAFLSGRVVGRIGARLPITVGLVMMGAALLFLTPIQPTTSFSSIVGWLILMGAGCGLVMSPMTTAVMSTVPPTRAGMASSTSNTMRQIGSVFGIAVLGNLLTRRFTDHLATSLRALHLPPAVTRQVMASAAQGHQSAAPAKASAAVDTAIGHAMGVSFTAGFSLTLWIAGILLLIGAPLALLTIRRTAPHHQREAERAREHGRQQALAKQNLALAEDSEA